LSFRASQVYNIRVIQQPYQRTRNINIWLPDCTCICSHHTTSTFH